MAKCKFPTTETAERVGEWCNLPDDILTMILSHLFGKDYICFLAVCRAWRSAPPPLRPIPNPSTITTSETSRYPSLFHFSGNSSLCKFYDPIYNGSYVAEIPDELIDARVYFSNYGWLLMCQSAQLFFYQPFTKQRVDLPSSSLHISEEYCRMCFSSPPTSPDCLVFGIAEYFSYGVDISIIRREEVSWTNFRFRYDAKNLKFCSSHSNPVFYKGAFYCLSIDGKLGVFDPKKRGCRRWRIIDKLQHPCESIQENFLVESNGELISICVGRMGEYVRIFRLTYEYEIRWEEVHSLRDKMIFASLTGSISLQTHGMENTIYFPSFDNGGNGLFYSLASRKFHSLGLPLARKDLYNMKRLLHCAWVTPTAWETYLEEELRWLPNPHNFVPSSERVKVKAAPSAHPSFVLTNVKDPNDQLFYNLFESCHNSEGIPEVRYKRIATCAFGWLLLVDWGTWDCLLLNPKTMEKVHLPEVPETFHICAISSSPNDPNCIVLLIRFCFEDVGDSFIYCRPGDSEWTVVTNKKPEELDSDSDESEESTDSDSDSDDEELVYDRISSIIGYQGKIYGLLHRLKLVEINFDPIFKVKLVKRNGWEEVWLPWVSFLGTKENYIHMVESCGEVFALRKNYRGNGEYPRMIVDVELFKLDFTRKIWEKVGSLGDNIAFFCCTFCCVSCSIQGSKIKGNSIYFTGYFLDETNDFDYTNLFYAFDFEDGSISVSLHFPDLHDFEWTGLILS